MALNLGMRVLVIDDMATMRRIISQMLNKIGFTDVSEAEDGQVAWTIIQAAQQEGKPIEFVVSDWRMPKMSGLELLTAIRKHPECKEVPFLMITAEAERGDVVCAAKAGVTNFIVKPFSAKVLKDKIEAIFRSK
ncbi:MAG: response regulator [Bacteriovoracaceae bacterium]|nr:response regulator [Bacteriovoracaceae bacterium]